MVCLGSHQGKGAFHGQPACGEHVPILGIEKLDENFYGVGDYGKIPFFLFQGLCNKYRRGAGIQNQPLPILYHAVYNLRNFLLSHHICIFADVKRHVNVDIFIEHRTAVAFDNVSVLFQLFQIPSYGFLRNTVEPA